MVQTFPLNRFQESTNVTIRALSSLTRRDADAVRATARAAATGYTVQEHDDYDGYLSLMVMPPLYNSGSFMVSGRTGAVDISIIHDDDLAPMGTFPSIGAAMIVLRPLLERVGRPGAAS